MTKSLLKEREPELRQHWKKIKLLQKLEKQNSKGEDFFLLDGPPYANFIPHVGHIRNTVYKDLCLRLAFMQGKNAYFQPGFDTHGLPVENKVEKEMHLESKKDIQKMGIANFMKTCKNLAATNKDLWLEVYDLLGSWYSWREPYLTYNNSYIQSGWWTLKKWWDKGLLYEGRKPGFWCPRCQTSLSGYEVTDSYTILRDPCIFLKFKLKGKDGYLLVFTTTPWTLISNTAIAALADADYVKVETAHGKLILAKKRLDLLTELEMGYTILEEFKGKDLNGVEYEPIINVPQQQELSKNKGAHRVYMSIPILKERVASKVAAKKGILTGDIFEEFVTVEEGTGLVHTAPGHGKTDNEIGKRYNLPEVSPVDEESKFTDMGGQFQGMFVKDADKQILSVLEKTGNLVYATTAEHKYPVCWRCKAPLIFQMSNQWFVNIEKARELILEKNQKSVKWLPEFARERFLNWVANAEDWNISRQRYWGVPIPIWKCSCGEITVIGSIDELKSKTKTPLPKDFDLHTANDVKLKCKCGKDMTRINDIADVWFDSGTAPWASMGYPFENKELFKEHFPVSRINEAQDQIRGWFYYLALCAALTFEKPSYKTVSMTGWTLDEKGEKMSKSLGNVILAKDAIEELGADTLRFGMCWDLPPYETQNFNKELIKKDAGRVVNTLSNLRNLLLTTQKISKGKLQTEDKWLLSRLNSLVTNATNSLDNFELNMAAKQIEQFLLEDLSRLYIQLVRERISEEDPMPYYVLNHSLLTLIKLLAPIMPYITEDVYHDLAKLTKLKESVHLEQWPKSEKTAIDMKLESQMTRAQNVIRGILSAREVAKRGVRWPVNSITVLTRDKETKLAIKSLAELIKRQTNVRDIETKEKITGSKTELTINKSQVGKDFKQDSQKILPKVTNKLLEEIHSKGETTIEKFKLTKAHINIKEVLPKHLISSEFDGGVVYLDTELTEELEMEGYARELTRRVQALRKEGGLRKTDKIELTVESPIDISKWKAEMQKKVGARTLKFGKLAKGKTEEIKSKKFKISLKKL